MVSSLSLAHSRVGQSYPPLKNTRRLYFPASIIRYGEVQKPAESCEVCASCWWAGGTFLSAVFPRKSVSGLSHGSMGVEIPVERVEMRLSSITVRERKVCFDVDG